LRTIGNILWFIGGGFLLFIGWGLAGVLCCLSFIGIPLGWQCFKIAGFLIWPFGKVIVYENVGPVSLLANILWILLLGWALALLAVTVGIIYCLTIVLIPFGLQSFKFAGLALMPFGAQVR